MKTKLFYQILFTINFLVPSYGTIIADLMRHKNRQKMQKYFQKCGMNEFIPDMICHCYDVKLVPMSSIMKSMNSTNATKN